jgi:Sulfotransferase family
MRWMEKPYSRFPLRDGFHRRNSETDSQREHPSGSSGTTPGPITPIVINQIAGRSGTTLTMSLLDHRLVAFDRVYPYENRYLAYMARLLTPVGESFEDSPEWNGVKLLRGEPDRFGPLPFEPLSLDRVDLRSRLVRHWWEAFSESLREFSGEHLRYYAEKRWGNMIGLLTEAQIGCAIINLVRDPRDVICSVRSFDEKRGFFGFGRTTDMTEDDFLYFLIDRMEVNLASMTCLDPIHQSTLVRYEDIIDNPARTAAAVGDFLGITLSAGPEDLKGEIFELHSTSEQAAGSVGRWRRDLSMRDVKAVTARLGHEMARYGYES